MLTAVSLVAAVSAIVPAVAEERFTDTAIVATLELIRAG